MIFVALEEASRKGELLLVDGGMCRFHRRRDGIVTIREILVLPTHRRRGIGKALFTTVLHASLGRGVIQAKCPVAYESNAFWKAILFTLISTKEGVNLWQFPSQG